MATEAQSMEFQAEVRELLRIMIHSLYSQREIFLRELISNSSDALDKRRLAGLTDSEVAESQGEAKIRLEIDAETRCLRVIDNGIGMTREEVVQNIGTIAQSGTRNFLDQLNQVQGESELPQLIGQFGVGFYASFMVADEVVLETRKAGTEGGTRWVSQGDGHFTVEDADVADAGTTVTLKLKPLEGDDADQQRDFTQTWVLQDIVKRYSDFVEYPIELDLERTEGEGDDAKVIVEPTILNSMKPIWIRPKSELSEEDYKEFYKHLSHDWEDPFATVHFRAEGSQAYSALLFVPKRRPWDFFQAGQPKSKLSLYVRRVLIDAECDELLPPWLRFAKGLVDSEDLPLNISRETLQHNRQIAGIRKRMVKKTLEALADKLEKERGEYEEFWTSFGAVLKEGIYHDDGFRDEVAAISLFASTAGDELTTLSEYVERMSEEQTVIYYLGGDDREALQNSPHLEAFLDRGFEVLFLTDAVDEFAMQRLPDFEGKKLQSIEKGDLDLESDEEKKAREQQQEEQRPLLDGIRDQLDENIKEVRFSNRLTDSAVVLVADEQAMSASQERMMRDMNQPVPASKRIMELNPNHPIVEKLTALRSDKKADGLFSDYCDLLYGQALLAEGSSLPDATAFSKLVTALMLKEA